MKTMSIDIETYSDIDLIKAGVYKYASSPNFEILLFAYAYDDEPVELVDLARGETLSFELLADLTDPSIIKTAYNANFERTCLAKWTGLPMPPRQWGCTAVHGAVLGLPQNLDGISKVLNMGEDKQKISAGKALIKYFCGPCAPTKVNGGRTRNHPVHDLAKWKTFCAYCKQDVVTERAVREKLIRFPLDPVEQEAWCLDQKINDCGVAIDKVLVICALSCDKENGQRLEEEARELTGLDNPNSVAQLTGWLQEQGLEVTGLTKEMVKELIARTDNPVAKRALELRREMSKTSTKKYEAMDRALCPDGRVRGLLQFYGANRTGRWAGRLVQVQNLPQNHLIDLELARDLLKVGNFQGLDMLFGNTPDTLSQLIRTAFVPSKGNRFIVADFSAIEARVIAWLAGEKWRMDVFNSHGKIYEASASAMFKVPIEEITKGNPLRQKGKISELALGYQGGVGALITMGALKMGLDEEELPELVETWRLANPAIVKLWREVESAATRAVKEKILVKLKSLTFSYEAGMLFIKLPSGRRLAYAKARIERDRKFNRLALTYDGVDQTRKVWCSMSTYGGKLVENIVQAIARDCLRDSMIALDEAGYHIVMHVHDEVILDEPLGQGSLEEACAIMGRPLSWAPGLPLRADGFETLFYKKD